MAENRRILNIYKQGQGAWARFTLAAVIMALVLWMLASINASFVEKRELMAKEETVLRIKTDKTGKMLRALTADDIAKLPENVVGLTVEIEGNTSTKSIAEVEKAMRGKKVLLAGNVISPVILDDKRIAELKDNPPSEKIAVIERANWDEKGEQKSLTIEEIETRVKKEGRKLVLAANVQVEKWWYRSALTVPGIDVPLRRGALVIALIFVLCALGTYKLLNKPRLADFLIESESELRRVDWPSKSEVVASTKVVVVVVILLMVVLFVLDLVNGTLIKDGLFKIFLPNT